MPTRKTVTLLLAALFGSCAPARAQPAVQMPGSPYQVSYIAGTRDSAGHFMGGTELRNFAVHRGKLYAGLGYWEDRPGLEGPQGATILVLDGPTASWRVDHEFDTRMLNGRMRDFTISALQSVRFTTDRNGAPLPVPIEILLSSSWDRTGTDAIFSRDDTTGTWITTTLSQDPPTPNFLPQVRSLGTHRDRQTGVDRVFAGTDPRGIFSGVYDPAVPGRIAWSAEPEFDPRTLHADAFPGLEGHLRISSFAECNGSLYAAVGQQVWQRIDSATPHWNLRYTNPYPFYSQTGLRGLTAIADPAGGPGQVLLAAVEGNRARIVRIDPRDGSETTDLDLGATLDQAWQTRVGYMIAAYNDMPALRDPRDGEVLLIGLEAYIVAGAPPPPKLAELDATHRLEGGGWYLVRHADGHYNLRQITGLPPDIGGKLVATRTIVASPFANDAAVYLGGYDANITAAHNTAWIVRAPIAAVLGETP
jgi:hypothetical protein